jgi:hypothetical protein
MYIKKNVSASSCPGQENNRKNLSGRRRFGEMGYVTEIGILCWARLFYRPFQTGVKGTRAKTFDEKRKSWRRGGQHKMYVTKIYRGERCNNVKVYDNSTQIFNWRDLLIDQLKYREHYYYTDTYVLLPLNSS